MFAAPTMFFLLTIFYVVALCVFGLASATPHVAGARSSNASTYVTLNCTFLYAFGVMLVLVLGTILYLHFTMYGGSLVKDGAQRFAFSTGFHLLLLLLCLWSFVQTTVTSVPPIQSYFDLIESDQRLLEQCADDEARGEFLDILAENQGVLTRGPSGGVRFCERCQQVKPDRAHHCSQCRRCVPKMDDHCAWFNNCVCFSTYKFFLLTIFNVLALCVFGLASATPHVAGAWSSNASTYVTLNCTFLYDFGVMLVLVLGSSSTCTSPWCTTTSLPSKNCAPICSRMTDRDVPVMAAARIQRWALLLSAYDYVIKHQPGKDNVPADALSRLPTSATSQPETLEEIGDGEYVLLTENLNDGVEPAKKLAALTSHDDDLAKVQKWVRE
ncbi:hypothetical protein V5799_017653 [Amblyomma americanum]|uniref:Palmitoyltransferase n=1 Tax=Amblyomma americanum TaxID=6943 RepID=A0AAQ4F1K7_AMBAM